MAVETQQDIVIKLTVAEQRKIVEAESKGPCFRMSLDRSEYRLFKRMSPDFTYSELSGGRYSVWRRQSDLAQIERTDPKLAAHIRSRIISDDVV